MNETSITSFKSDYVLSFPPSLDPYLIRPLAQRCSICRCFCWLRIHPRLLAFSTAFGKVWNVWPICPLGWGRWGELFGPPSKFDAKYPSRGGVFRRGRKKMGQVLELRSVQSCSCKNHQSNWKWWGKACSSQFHAWHSCGHFRDFQLNEM